MSFKASQLLVYFSTEVAGKICIVKFCVGRSWQNGSNIFSPDLQRRIFSIALQYSFLSWLLGSSKNLSFFSLALFLRSIRYRKNQKNLASFILRHWVYLFIHAKVCSQTGVLTPSSSGICQGSQLRWQYPPLCPL